MTTLTTSDLITIARAAFEARGLDFDALPQSIAMSFAGDVVLTGVDGGDTFEPHDECVRLCATSELDPDLRSQLWTAATEHEYGILELT